MQIRDKSIQYAVKHISVKAGTMKMMMLWSLVSSNVKRYLIKTMIHELSFGRHLCIDSSILIDLGSSAGTPLHVYHIVIFGDSRTVLIRSTDNKHMNT